MMETIASTYYANGGHISVPTSPGRSNDRAAIPDQSRPFDGNADVEEAEFQDTASLGERYVHFVRNG